MTVLVSTSGTLTSKTVSNGFALASTMQVRIQASDLATTSSKPTYSLVSTTPSATVTVLADAGLSSGAKGGIGIGVVIAALLVIAIIVGALLLRKKRLAQPNVSNSYDGYSVQERRP